MKKNKIKILRIIHTLNPERGGPQNAILDSSLALSKRGFKVDIVTGDDENLNFSNLKNIKVFNKGPGIGDYGFNIKLFFWLLKNRNNYDSFIIHGIWGFYTLISRILLNNNYFVFTHGQLDPFFSLNLIKKIKKKIYWFLIEKQNLLSSKSLLLTTSKEKKQLNNTFVNTNGIKKKVVGYGIIKAKFNKKKATNLFFKKFPILKNKKFLLFLGRFHEKKGCDILIKAIKKLTKKNVNINILLAGPDSKYKNKIKILSKNLELKNNIFWSDIMLGDLKWGAISASSAMVLSSHGENFGVALAEAMSCSKPVLTTSKVNIYNDILNFKAGLVSKNKVNDFAKILEEYSSFNKKQIKQLSKNSYNCFNKNFNLDSKDNMLAKFLKNQNYDLSNSYY